MSLHVCVCVCVCVCFHWFICVWAFSVFHTRFVRDSAWLFSCERVQKPGVSSAECSIHTFTKKDRNRKRHGEAVLTLVFRCCKGVWDIWVYVKRRQMWSDRPLSAACSVLWQREREWEWVKIHPAPGRRSLWQPLLWWRQGCTWSDGCHGTLGNSPSRAAGGGTHTQTHFDEEWRGEIRKGFTWGEIQEDTRQTVCQQWCKVTIICKLIYWSADTLYFYSSTFI